MIHLHWQQAHQRKSLGKKVCNIGNAKINCIHFSMLGAILSSASLPSHKTRWNEEEDELLKEALVIQGKKKGGGREVIHNTY